MYLRMFILMEINYFCEKKHILYSVYILFIIIKIYFMHLITGVVRYLPITNGKFPTHGPSRHSLIIFNHQFY